MSLDGVRIEILRDERGFSGLEAGWERLCEALAGQVTVFASFPWHRSWWRHYGGGRKLHLFSMWQGDQLVGVAPLMAGRMSLHGLPVKTIGFMQNNQSLHNDFIVLPEFRDLFFRKLLQSLSDGQSNRWDVLHFRNVSPASDNYRSLLEVLEAEGLIWERKATPIDSPYLIPSGGWSGFLAGRSSRTRKNLRNIRNRLHGAGEVSVINIRTAEEFLACREELFEVAQQSWTERLGDSLGSAANRDFFESLALTAAARGWLSIWALYLDGRMIAVEFHLRAFGREHALRGHFLPEFGSLSPGTFLESAVLEHLFEETGGVEVYDFCGSFDAYKKKWTDTFVPHCDLYIFKDQIYSRCVSIHEFKVVAGVRRAVQYLQARHLKNQKIKSFLKG